MTLDEIENRQHQQAFESETIAALRKRAEQAEQTLAAYETNQARAIEQHGWNERFVWGCDTVDALCDVLQQAECELATVRMMRDKSAELADKMKAERDALAALNATKQ